MDLKYGAIPKFTKYLFSKAHLKGIYNFTVKEDTLEQFIYIGATIIRIT